MKESEYAPIILETIGSNGASIGTLKTSCGQGNKISNMKKALYRLLKEGKIEFNGYDKEFTKFSYDGIMLKKVNPNITNPIFVKGLLDNPLKDDNYLKITKIFKKRIDDINRIYNYEIKTLENIMDKMPLKKAIKLGYIKSDDAYTKSHNRKDVTKNNESFKHLCWHCSRSISELFTSTIELFENRNIILRELPNRHGLFKKLVSDFNTTFIFMFVPPPLLFDKIVSYNNYITNDFDNYSNKVLHTIKFNTTKLWITF